MTDKTKPATKSHSDPNGELQGEGNYDAARRYDKETEKFAKDHKGDMHKLGEDAKKAVEGPEGDQLRKAEDIGKSKARH